MDILVEISTDAHMPLTGFSRLRLDLIDILGRDVDLAEWHTLR